MIKQKVIMKNWKFIPVQKSDTTWCQLLYGEVYNHPKIEDGHRVITSEIIKMDISDNIVETINTIYMLEKSTIPYMTN